MHQQKGKKILIYFFLLLLVGSINNIGLRNLNFKEIDISAENIRMALNSIQNINQKFDIEKILDIIFSDFCIGK